ncbi:DUF937 domain-containing protein [Microvirga alba]|uniref:DUF937 domain-containing protein n=1 Tax=Microvirga alba TaxID=2791025 RepID=A0A931BPC1_9HYPH|nr:DUF937 domain-containing protein [Microvirga alba]MBF9234521.1 DUF937 domain-containing protein [Microvirga alba]
MPTNLISLVMQFLTPDLINRAAMALGLDRTATEKAVLAAVPALFGGFTKASATPDGARKLYDTVSQQPPGILDSLAGTLGGPGQKMLAERGSGIVSSLLGGSTTQALTGAISRFAGIDQSSTSPLLGVLASVVTGALAKETSTSRLDAPGLAQLLSSQRGNIQAALPAGFADILRGSGLLSDVEGIPGQATRATTTAAQAASASAQRAAHGASSMASSARWQYWAIPAVVALAAAWWLFGNRMTPQVTEQQARTSTEQVGGPATTGAIVPADQIRARVDQAMTSLKSVAGGTEIANQTTSTLDALRASLNGITDTATAQAALPKLLEEQAQMEKVRGLVGQLPADGRTALATIVASGLPALNEQFAKVLAIPGVAPILKQQIDGMRADLATLAKSPA